MLRFPNPGSTIANFVAVYVAAFRALNGRVINLDHIVRAVVDANLATSSGYVGDEAVIRSTREDRSRDPLYNQMKMYAELFRTMGWLHPTAASTLKFTFTLLGEQLVAAGPHYWPLLRQCVLGISYPTRVLTIACEARLRPFSFILKTMKRCAGYLSRDEMIIGPLSADDDRSTKDMSGVLAKIRSARRNATSINAALDALSRSRRIQVNTLRNYTRWPIAVLRDSGWVEEVWAKYSDGKKYTAFALTETGREAAEMVEDAVDLRLADVEALGQKERDAAAIVAHYRMLGSAGFDVATVQSRIDAALKVAVRAVPALADSGRAILFSPFQSMALDDIHRVFPAVSSPVAPDNPSNATAAGSGGRDARSHLFVAPKLVTAAAGTTAEADAVRAELRALLGRTKDPKKAAALFCENHSKDTKEAFYPLVTHLFQILGAGFPAWGPADFASWGPP